VETNYITKNDEANVLATYYVRINKLNKKKQGQNKEQNIYTDFTNFKTIH